MMFECSCRHAARIASSKQSKEQGSALIAALSVLVILSMLGVAALNSSDSETRLVHERIDRLTAFALAESGLEHGKQYVKDNIFSLDALLEDFEDDPDDMRIEEKLDVNPEKSYVMNLEKDPDNSNVFFIKSTGTIYWEGRQDKAEVTLRLEVEKDMSESDFSADAPFSIYSPEPKMKMKGKPGISGTEYDLPQNFNCSGGNCEGLPKQSHEANYKPPIYSQDNFEQLDYKDKHLEYEGSEVDDPVKIGGSESNANESWQDFAKGLAKDVEDEKFGRLISRDSSVSGDAEWGNRDNPEVTVVKDKKLSGTVDGAGILILKDGADITGNYHFEGLVFVLTEKDQEELKMFSKGTPYIYGSAIVTGEDSPEQIEFKGTANVYYNEEALGYAKNAIPPALNILSWQKDG